MGLEKIKALESVGIRHPRSNYVIRASDIESATNMLHALGQDISAIAESVMTQKPECDRRLTLSNRWHQPSKTSKVYYVNRQTGRKELPVPTWQPEGKSKKALKNLTDCVQEDQKSEPISHLPMKIAAHQEGGRTIDVIGASIQTIEHLKRQVLWSEGIPMNHQHFIFGGKTLENQRTLADCSISDGSIVTLLVMKQPPRQPSDADIDSMLSETLGMPPAKAVKRLLEISLERLHEYAMNKDLEDIPPKERLSVVPEQCRAVITTRIFIDSRNGRRRLAA